MVKAFARGILTFCLAAASCSLPQKAPLPNAAAQDSGRPSAPSSLDLLLAEVASTLQHDPTSASAIEARVYFDRIVSASSGSGGYFLGAQEIAWLERLDDSLTARHIDGTGVQQMRREMHSAFADSYFHEDRLEKALTEYSRARDQYGIEDIVWRLRNRRGPSARVQITEYAGPVPEGGAIAATAENKRFKFIAYFKGPVFRYDKASRRHAVLLAPVDHYGWSDSLRLTGRTLRMTFANGSSAINFDNVNRTGNPRERIS